MVAVPPLFGRLTAADYEDEVAQDAYWTPCAKIVCYEDLKLLPPTITTRKRAIGNAITVEFTDGSRFAEVVVSIRLVMRRRADGIPVVTKI